MLLIAREQRQGSIRSQNMGPPNVRAAAGMSDIARANVTSEIAWGQVWERRLYD
jgi:hypothetical protein